MSIPKRPLHHSVLFWGASFMITEWSMAIYPDRLGPYLGLVTFLGVWLAWYLFFGALYGPVEAPEEAQERGGKGGSRDV